MRKILLNSVLCTLLTTSLANAVPTDFDGDGVSDLTRVETSSAKDLTWKAVLSSTGETKDLGTLGKQGDVLAAGQWLPGGSYIGVVSLNSSAGTLVWSMVDGTGTKQERTFGKKGDLVLAGGDFNGNGTADAAVARLENGKAKWQIAYDIFTSESVNPVSFFFGTSGDRAFYARADGSTVDWIGMIRKGAGRASAARMKNLVTDQVRQFTRLPGFASTGERPRAVPVHQVGAADLLAFPVSKSKGTEIRVFTFAGAEVGANLVDGAASLATGEFVSGGLDEIAFQSSAEAGLFFPAAGEVREISVSGGTLTGEYSVGALGATVAAPPSNTGGGGEDSAAAPAGSCSQVVSLPSSHVYKTVGSHHFTDIRRNTAGTVIKAGGRGPFPGCVQVLSTNGKVLANMGLYSKGAGWAARYYAGIGCGASTPLNGAAIASRARSASGSSKIYLSFGGGLCYGPIEATQCYNSISC